MPDAHTILDRLNHTASALPALALAWHVAIALALGLLATGAFRPSRRCAAALLSLPLLSVSVVAFSMNDVFNGSAFLLLTASSALGALRMSSEPAQPAGMGLTALATVLLAYGAVYPHFAPPSAAWWHTPLFAPVGLLPCPTLGVVLGFTLLARGLGSRTWMTMIAAASALYGALGVTWLGVWLDLGLLLAALVALSVARTLPGPRGRAERHDTDAEAAHIRAFMACERIALIGVSSDPSHFSRAVMRALAEAGRSVVPVHPSADFVEGSRAYARVGDIVPPVHAALIMTPARASERVVEECALAGVTQVWLHRGVGTGAVSAAAIAAAHRHRLQLVAGRCPLMFLGDHATGVHGAHATLLRLTGRYPRDSGARSRELITQQP